MSRYTSGLIPSTPTVYSGTALQGAINDFLSAFHSGSFDTVRPALAAKGMIWSKDIGANSVDIMFFDGTNNVQIGRVNTATSEFSGVATIVAIRASGTGLRNAADATSVPSRTRSVMADAAVSNVNASPSHRSGRVG